MMGGQVEAEGMGRMVGDLGKKQTPVGRWLEYLGIIHACRAVPVLFPLLLVPRECGRPWLE